jgi:steroid 5-alpha reductase family enzyme
MAATLALPAAITTASDCANFDLTVRPYLPQLYSLPVAIYGVITNSSDRLHDLHALYLNTNPFIAALFLSLFLAPIFLLVSEVNKNYSQVDRAWSIVPAVYVGHYTYWAHAHGLPAQRLDNILVFAVIWSTRLTFNYWRKGGYSIGSEDYRWERVKAYVGPAVMFVFNVTFIATIQSVR